MDLEETNNVTAATQDVLAHHLECFGKLDLAGTMSDSSINPSGPCMKCAG